MGNWAAIAYFMTQGGENRLLILSIGGTLILLIGSFGEAICMTQMTVVSQILGSRNYHSLYTAFRPGIIIATTAILILSVFLLIFPNWTFQKLFPKIMLDPFTLKLIFAGVWLSASFCMYSCLPASYVLAFKDTCFSSWAVSTG